MARSDQKWKPGTFVRRDFKQYKEADDFFKEACEFYNINYEEQIRVLIWDFISEYLSFKNNKYEKQKRAKN